MRSETEINGYEHAQVWLYFLNPFPFSRTVCNRDGQSLDPLPVYGMHRDGGSTSDVIATSHPFSCSATFLAICGHNFQFGYRKENHEMSIVIGRITN